MNDHFTTHLLWAVSSGGWISNESIFCHESHHSYLMCNKEQSQTYSAPPACPCFSLTLPAGIFDMFLSVHHHHHSRARLGLFRDKLIPSVPSREHCGLALSSPENSMTEFSSCRHIECEDMN